MYNEMYTFVDQSYFNNSFLIFAMNIVDSFALIMSNNNNIDNVILFIDKRFMVTPITTCNYIDDEFVIISNR